MRIVSLLRLTLVAALAGCASAQVTTDWDRDTRFANYHTYAWMDTPRMQAMQQGTLFDRRLRSAVEEALRSGVTPNGAESNFDKIQPRFTTQVP